MSIVAFHEVKGPRWELALCRLVEAAYGRGERLYLWADSEAAARRLDDLLWTFRDEAFVPHGLWQGEARLEEPVAVGWQAGNPNGATCLVLARDAAPEEVAGFPRVLDLAPVDVPELRQAARARYRAFRDAGFDVSFRAAGP
ncbi:MAG: DNA polymerase III subunit chi [Deferrisomatales bacterium]